MGGKRGGGYRQSSSSPEVFRRNIDSAAREFSFSHLDLSFGIQGRRGSIRVIYSDEPASAARRLFSILSRGGIYGHANKPGMFRVQFDDGTHLVLRLESSSGGPALSINPGWSTRRSIMNHKIHFERKP